MDVINKMQAEIAAKTGVETAPQTTIQTASQTIPQTAVETAPTAQKQRKKVILNLSSNSSKNDSKELLKVAQNNPQNVFKEEEEMDLPLMDEDYDWEDEMEPIEEEIQVSHQDPLDEHIADPEPRTIKEQVKESVGDSTKSLESLAMLGEAIMDFLDNSKAQLCAAISGKEAALYASDQKAKKALIEATKTYLQQVGVKGPTPAQTFLIAVGMWLLPSLGTAGIHRLKIVLAKKKQQELGSMPAAAPVAPSYTPPAAAYTPAVETAPQYQPAETTIPNNPVVDPVSVVDYSQTKEYQAKRRLFDRHAKGTYRYLADGTYANVDLADEYPSPELLPLLEEGKSNADIRELLYKE